MATKAKKATALDGFTVKLGDMDRKDEATRLVGVLDMFALIAPGGGWHDDTDTVREAARRLDVPYLLLWLLRDTYSGNPSVTLQDIEEFQKDPIAEPVFRKWVEDLEEQRRDRAKEEG